MTRPASSACSARWRLPLAWIVCVASACSPTLDWREFVPEGSGLRMTFPCRPDRHARAVALAGETVRMEMLVCSAGDATYSVAFFDVTDPARVSAVLGAWRAASVRNVQGAAASAVAARVGGMTPNDEAVRLAIDGRLPDGRAVREHAAFFARGLRVYAASVIGAAPPPQAIDTFFAGLQFPT